MAPPPKITLYVLRSNCTKFGAFVRCVPILVLSDLTITFIRFLWFERAPCTGICPSLYPFGP